MEKDIDTLILSIEIPISFNIEGLIEGEAEPVGSIPLMKFLADSVEGREMIDSTRL